MKRLKVIKILLIVLSVVLFISFIVLMAVGISEIHDAGGHQYRVESGDYVGDLRAKRYEGLLETAERDTVIGRTNNGESEAYRALAGYFRSAVLAETFEKDGRTGDAAAMREQMEAYAAQCPDYTDLQDDMVSRIAEAVERGGAVYGGQED